MKENNTILDKTFQFSLDVVKLYMIHLENKEYVLAKQFLRSGTSVGAMSEEAQGAHSKKDFIAKFEIAYKEARETSYWLNLLTDAGLLDMKLSQSFLADINELKKILASILKTSKNQIRPNS